MADEWELDPAQIATQPRTWEGTFKPGELEGVDDLVANGEGELHYRVTAGPDRQRRKVVSCIIEGFVFLECQATMDVFRHSVRVEDRIVLVDREEQLPPIEVEGDDEDYVVAHGPMDVRDLVGDAVILALPMIPRKPGMEAAEPQDPAPVTDRPSPFAALKGLKRPK